MVRDITVLQAVVASAGAAVLYDAELPNGTIRFSEFFEFDGHRVRELRIQYNAADYLTSGGRWTFPQEGPSAGRSWEIRSLRAGRHPRPGCRRAGSSGRGRLRRGLRTG